MDMDLMPQRRSTDVGDLNSSEKGSGARDNGGKPAVQLLPWKRIAPLMVPGNEAQGHVKQAVEYLGAFQCGDDMALSHLLKRAMMAAEMSMKEVLAETAHVLDFGATYYAPWNWAKGMPWSVCIGCLGRHLIGHPGEPGMWDDARGLDHKSGRMHVGHVGANVMFLLEYMTSYRQGDDRPKELQA
jgi:hypothetical protein